MTLDAHISPKLVPWLRDQFNLEATHIRHLSLHQAEDTEIFETARRSNVVVITKDQDFVALLERLGPPPCVVWLTCGNTSNEGMRDILKRGLPDAIQALEKGEPLVEITGN